MGRTFWGRTCLISAALTVVALAFFSVRLMENPSQAQAAKPQATAPDFSGIWLGKGIQSLSPSDPMGKKTDGI
jgi:peptidoglycan/LPS O-acetylase OafA/YrhL